MTTQQRTDTHTSTYTDHYSNTHTHKHAHTDHYSNTRTHTHTSMHTQTTTVTHVHTHTSMHTQTTTVTHIHTHTQWCCVLVYLLCKCVITMFITSFPCFLLPLSLSLSVPCHDRLGSSRKK